MALTLTTDVFGTCRLGNGSVFKNLQESSYSSEEHEKLKERFVMLIDGVIDVINKQMHDYIVSKFTTLSPPKCAQTKSAPVHNMIAEQALGLAHHQLRRPNANVV